MDSLWDLFCAVGITYTLILTALFYGKGLLQVIWPIIIACFIFELFPLNPATDMFVINETLVPEWIFHPMSLLSSPILAFFFALSIRAGISDSRRFG